MMVTENDSAANCVQLIISDEDHGDAWVRLAPHPFPSVQA
ncbi:DNA helicase [Salmonella phage 41]|nr:DNA helicase [Salmonella phage 41]